MSDIFISYASEDRARAQALAEALGRENWTVWWDRHIPPGRTFDAVIEEALDAARCVIVLWSRNSVSSDWVKTEAAEGLRRKILVPALIEETKIPLEFRRIQAADLSGWGANSPHPGFAALVTAVAATLNAGPTTTVVPPPKSPSPASPEPPSKLPQSHDGWRAELIETTWASRKLRVHLSLGTHILEFSCARAVQAVKVDDVVVAQAGDLVAWAGKYEFQIADGDQTYPAIIESDQPILPFKLRPCRLTVAGHLLYSE